MSLIQKLTVTFAFGLTLFSGGTRCLLAAAAQTSQGGENSGRDTAADHSDSGGSCK